MKIKYQAPSPIVNFYASTTRPGIAAYQCYQIFSANTFYDSGRNLQSYTFNRSIDNLEGSFTINVVESTNINSNFFWDKVKPLDIVEIIEERDDYYISGYTHSHFLGVVVSKTISGVASSNSRQITISGKSIEYLFNLYTIALDVTAMSFSNNDSLNSVLKENLSKSGNQSLYLKQAIQTIFDNFVDASEAYPGVSSTKIKELINKYYNNTVATKIDTSFIDTSSLSFYLPICNNMFSDSTITLFNYIKNLLPAPVYEIYGYCNKDTPKIKIRECPFDTADWLSLKKTIISADVVTDYNFTESNQEVYTAFLSYVEGAAESAEKYKKEQESIQGYSTAAADSSKIAIYGYKPLFVNFIGFNSGSNDTEYEQTSQTLSTKLSALNTRIKNWYVNMDTMLSGDITIVNLLKKAKPKIGEKLEFMGIEFYVKAETHSWKFGDNPTINYSVDRGGKYINGSFNEVTGISKNIAEWEKIN